MYTLPASLRNPPLPNSPPDASAVGPLPMGPPRDGIRHTQPTQFQDPSDIGAQIFSARANQPLQQQRVLEYYGDPRIKNILVVVGYQVHQATAQGVLITENGPNTHRTLIPWHRVHDLKFAPGDPIMEQSKA